MYGLSRNKIILIVAAICVFGVIGYKLFFDKSDEIVLNGNVEIYDVNVSFRVSGRIADILVFEGKELKKGDIIAVLDKDTFEVAVKQAKANMEEAKANLKNALKNYERTKDLYKKKSTSEKIYDESLAAYEMALAKRDASVAFYEQAIINLADTELKSPVDGIVLTRNIEPGEMIGAGITAFSIMPNAKNMIKTFAGEDVLSRIKYGDVVYTSIESMPNKKFKGHIGFISSEAEFTPKNIETKELRTSLVYRIRVIIDEPSPELKQGMPVTVTYEK